MPGLTAYFGLLDIGKPQTGETVVVSGAAGAVGTTVCQIAKIKGCRVVGIAGSDEKNEYLEHELWVDKTINYKTEPDIRTALKTACPTGVDVFFDNVGGHISDAVMTLISKHARSVICGQISLYNNEKPDVGPRVQPYLLVKSALMQGFIITDYAARFGEGMNQLGQWLKEGKLKYAEHIVEGPIPKTKDQRRNPTLSLTIGEPIRSPLATFPLIVHSKSRLILLSRIDGDAPRA